MLPTQTLPQTLRKALLRSAAILARSAAILAAATVPAVAGAETPGPGDRRASPPGAARSAADTLPTDPRVRTGRLENGLRYYVRENARPEDRAELRLVVDAGSVLEDGSQRGLAHFVEHMAFNGTERFARQELVSWLESIGMKFGPHVNAYTSFDETVYMLTVPTDSAGVLETSFTILEEWAHALAFDSTEIEKERGVVIEEWRGRLGAEERMREVQFPVLFRGSRYAERLPIGTKESLETFEHADLERFYRDWYRPDLMAVVAVGDFGDFAYRPGSAAGAAEARDHGRGGGGAAAAGVEEGGRPGSLTGTDAVAALIRDRFSGLRVADKPAPRPLFEVPDHEETLYSVATDPEAQTWRVTLYHKQPPREVTTVEAYRQGLVETLYNQMLDRRLFEIGRRADAPFVHAGSAQGSLVRTKEAYYLYALAHPGEIGRALEAVLREGERVARHGFTEPELEREKAERLRAVERAYDEREKLESAAFASSYVHHFLEGGSLLGIEQAFELHRELVPGVTLGEVDRLAEEWIADRNRVVLVNAPAPDGAGAAGEAAEAAPDTAAGGEAPERVPGEAELSAVIASVEASGIEPYEDVASDAPLVETLPEPGRVVAEEAIEGLGVHIWTLSNGVRVFLKPTDFKDDQVVLRSYSPGGTSLVPDSAFGRVFAAAGLVERGGVGSRDLVALEKALAGKAVSASPYIGSLFEGVSGEASPKDLETLFQLVWLYVTEPRKDADAYQSFQRLVEGFLANRAADPEAAFQDTLGLVLADHHPRAVVPTVEAYRRLDLDASYALYRERFADAGDFTFALVGAFDPEAVRPLVERWLGGLPSTPREETWRDTGIDPPPGVARRVVRKGSEPRARTAIVFTGPFEDSPANRQAIRALEGALQIRLRDRLREDLGGTYSVGVSAGYEALPDEEYSVSIGFGSDPERADELAATVFREVEAFRNEGPTEEEAAKSREQARRDREEALKENGFWASQLLAYDRSGEDPRLLVSYELIDAIDAAGIREAAARWLDPERYVWVTLLPEEGAADIEGAARLSDPPPEPHPDPESGGGRGPA